MSPQFTSPRFKVGDIVYLKNGSRPFTGYRVLGVDTLLIPSSEGRLPKTVHCYRLVGRYVGDDWMGAPLWSEIPMPASGEGHVGFSSRCSDVRLDYMRANEENLGDLDEITDLLLKWIQQHNPKALESRDETAGKIVKTLAEGGAYVLGEEGRALLSDGSTAREGDWIENHIAHTSALVSRLELHSYDPNIPEDEQVWVWLQAPDAADTILVPPEVLQRDYKSLTP